MIVVYFETPNSSYAQIAAIFQDSDTYNICLPALEKHAKENGFVITESLQETDINEIKSTYDSYGKECPFWYTRYLTYRTGSYGESNKSFDQFLKDAKFTTSWDWLMPVLEKICRLKIGDGIETVDYPNLRTFGMINEETGGIMVRLNGFQVFEAETLIEATLLAVVDFLEWQSKADR